MNQQNLNNSTFLPTDKYLEKRRKKILKASFDYRYSKKRPSEKSAKAKQKAKEVAKAASAILLAALLGMGTYTYVQTAITNNAPPVKDHFSQDVFNPNGNDYEFNDGKLSPEELSPEAKKTLVSSFKSVILEDASSRSEDEITHIDSILSFSLVPVNLFAETNEFDKYYFSILFTSNDTTYALNYFTGTAFTSSAELMADFYADLINYTNYQCAVYTCDKISEDGQKIKDAIGDSVAFVRDADIGCSTSGEEVYVIPVFNRNGGGKVYSAWCSPIDAYDLNPMEVLYEELSENSLSNFSATDFESNDSLQKAEEFFKESSQKSSEKQTNEKTK